jgi:RNA polymerase sigma-70 factor (ECF subfamily)
MAYQTAWRILGHIQDTEDAVQEAMLEALRTDRKESVRNWGGLLRRTATRRALDRLRKRRGFSAISPHTPAPRDERPDSIAEARELAEWLRQTLTQLSERQAEVFCLRYFGEMTNTEIAATLAITVDAVGVALHKARSRIAQQWNERDKAIRAQQ